MFFKNLLNKMKKLVVIKYRSDNFIDNLVVTFDKDNLKKTDGVSSSRIDFKKIYENRMI